MSSFSAAPRSTPRPPPANRGRRRCSGWRWVCSSGASWPWWACSAADWVPRWRRSAAQHRPDSVAGTLKLPADQPGGSVSASKNARDTLVEGLGRRGFLRVAAVLSGGGVAAGLSGTPASAVTVPREILQPGVGPIHGQHYLPSLVDQVRWGYVPSTDSQPTLRIGSGDTVTVDTVSHEGILEDQGRDPVAFFGSHGVPAKQVLTDAIAIAAGYQRTTRSFDHDGPHVVTGPIHVDGAVPGDVLKVEMLSFLPRVPYGVVSSRHGKGALARMPDGSAPAGITPAEVMPPIATD